MPKKKFSKARCKIMKIIFNLYSKMFWIIEINNYNNFRIGIMKIYARFNISTFKNHLSRLKINCSFKTQMI